MKCLKMKMGVFTPIILLFVFCGNIHADESDLGWSTFLGGGSGDYGQGVAVNDFGSVYVTGLTSSVDFPTTTGALDSVLNCDDVFVVKLDPTGSALQYATFLGGDSSDHVEDIALDNSGAIYITGFTVSTNFPTTAGSFDTTLDGPDDAFVAKLNPTGSDLDYATFLGGGEYDVGRGIVVNASGNAYVVGETYSGDFPSTAGAFDETFNGSCDVFVTKIDPAGNALNYATYIGGYFRDHGGDIALDKIGNAYVTGMTISPDFPISNGALDSTHNGGWDAFVAKINPTGDTLDYATYLGGGDPEWGFGISVDNTGNAYVTGYTWSHDFPATIGAYDTSHNDYSDAFVAKLGSTGSALEYATFLGGSHCEEGESIVVDSSGNAYVTGHTTSDDFPVTAGSFDATYNGGTLAGDIFLVRINKAGSNLTYATFLGGDTSDVGTGIALDSAGDVYLTGYTKSSKFPTTTGTFDTTHEGRSDAFVVKLQLSSGTQVVSESPTNCLPNICVLSQNYPNPFNANTEIRYQLPENGLLALKVFNTLGQEVRTLMDTYQKAGAHAVSWDGRDNTGQEVASGVYLCRLQTGNFNKISKIVLIK